VADPSPIQTAPPVEAAFDDPEFVARLKKGEPAAFEKLVRDNSPRLLIVARRFLPIEADALDALQDAFLSAFKALPAFDGNSRVSTWLHRIVVNACLMKIRSRSRRPETQVSDDLPILESGASRGGKQLITAAELAAQRAETRELVRKTIEELPEAYRTVLLLRDIEEFDTEQVARMMELSAGAVKTRLHRARLALRELLLNRLGNQFVNDNVSISVSGRRAQA
jgi:RNA polymerase sigma-70 factor (ECF subfamily)